MKKGLLILLFTLALVTAACSADKAGKLLVAETGAGNITEDEFYDELKERYGQDLLKEMVIVKVLENKYDVKKEEVEEKVNETKEQLGDQFNVWLASQGFKDEESFQYAVRINILNEKAIYDGIKISEEEMKNYYDRMKTEIQAQHILVDNEKTAREVKQKLDEGGSFEKLANEYSKDSSNAKNGGKLDYFSVGAMVPEFEEAVYQMEVGEISDPVKTEYGYHIIKVTDQRDNKKVGTYEENKEAILTTLKSQKVNPNDAEKKINELIKETEIDIKVKDFKDLFKEGMVNQNG